MSARVEGSGATELVIVGAGGHGREVLDVVESLGGRHEVVGFVDDTPLDGEAAARVARRGARVVGDVAWLAADGRAYVIAIGSSAARRRIDAALGGVDRDCPVLVHASASIGSDNRFAPGVLVGSLSVVTTNVSLGRHTHVNAGCSVQHDTVVGDFVTLSPGVMVNGDVTIGDDVFVGTGAIVTRGCSVGDGAVIGAGAVVLHDVEPGVRVLGAPARRG